MAAKEGGEEGPEVNGQMLLKNPKIFCQCSLNSFERKNYLEMSLTFQNCYFKREIFIKESIFQNATKKLGEYESQGNLLTLYRPMFPSYRNQSLDLRWKSTDWFLYDGSIGR